MTAKSHMDCPKCNSSMIKSTASEAKLRMKVMVWNSKGMFAVCKSCGEEVPITMNFLKSVESNFVYEVNGETNQSDIIKKACHDLITM